MTISSRKKILFLITKSNWGGAQRYVFDIATHLDPKRFDVVVALGGEGRLLTALKEKNIKTISLTHLERDISLKKEIGSIVELIRVILKEKPDVLHINSSKAGGLGAVLGRLLRVPSVIFTAHGWAFNEERPQWQKFLIAVLHWVTVLFTHTTIAVSRVTKAQLRFPWVQHKIKVIHNGRTIAAFKDAKDVRLHFSTQIPALLPYISDFWSVTIAELHPIKQHDVVIRALAEVAQAALPFRHIIIGAGEERERLNALITQYKLTDRVFLAGSVEEASEYLKGFDLFILASKSEGLAYVLIEASMAGLPIIASNVGGIPEVISRDDYGLLFQEGDASMLADLYQQLYADTALREKMSIHAAANAQNFTFEKMLAATTALYDSNGSRAS